MLIAVVADPGLVNSNHRVYFPMMALERRGHGTFHNRPGQPRYPMEVLRQADAVLVHRFIDQETRQSLQRLRAAGIGLIWDNDDDIANLPRSNPHYRGLSGLNRQRLVSGLDHVLRSVDIATSPSRTLVAQFHERGAADARYVENYVPSEFVETKPRPHDGIVIACLAGLEHQTDYQQLRLRETLLQLLEEHSDLRVLTIGVGLGLPEDRCEHHALVGFLDLPRTMAAADFGLAPIVDIPWNRARSNVKLKEYASAGLPWLASPIGPYGGMGEQQGGQLVDDDDWYGAIKRMVVDGRGRRKLAKRAAKWAKGETIDENVGVWEQIFDDAAARGSMRRSQRHTSIR